MGSSNSVFVTIHLDRTNPFFFTGELVSGTVNVNIKEGHIKVDEIFLSLNGEIGYTTHHTVQLQNGATRTTTNYHTKSFLTEKKLFERSEPEQKELIYHAGEYSWKFEIPLPVQLPPSINEPKKYPHVRYYLKLVIDKPWYKPNTNEILYLTVFPRVNLLQNPQCLKPTMFSNQNRKDVSLKGNLDKLGYLPGETITGILEIENPQRILVKKIQLILIQHNRIESSNRKETIFETTVPTIDHRNDERIKEKFSMTIPSIPLAPSYDFYGGYNNHMVSAIVNYCLELDVKVEGMFTNFNVTIPIILATELDTNSNQHQLNQTTNFTANSLSYYPEINADDNRNPPPSYDSVSRLIS